MALGSLLLPQMLMGQNRPLEGGAKKSLKGFIVSDAHFGWKASHQWAMGMQPTPEEQQAAMDNILKRFPDLDLFLDTGDAHHNDHHNNENPYQARQDWVDVIQGGCGELPFYYVIGNHEIRSNEDADPELRSNKMSSTSCRPYYSFDMYGVHFISFPELIRAVHITEEEWNWLELDLAVNKDKTIVMLSHNNVIGTTSGNDAGYRGIMESDRMLRLFEENPNIISWMHGHNHNYEVVKQQDMLFVSNGRIGGFDPSGGKHGIGGIYFELNEKGLKVRCYSAEKDMFLDELDASLSQELARRTTFAEDGDFAYSYGVGGAVNGERLPAHMHHAGAGQESELFISACASAVINDDAAMSKYTERKAHHGLDKILLAGKVNHGNAGYDYLNPGIRLKANDNWWTTLTMPSDHNDRHTYYRCPAGKSYRVSLDMTVPEGSKQGVWLRLHVYDSDGVKLRIVQTEEIKVKPGRQELSELLEVPEIRDFENIYADASSDKLVNIAVEASFTGMNTDIDIHALRLEQAGVTEEAYGLIVDGESHLQSGVLKPGEIVRMPLKTGGAQYEVGRSLNEVRAGGSRRLNYLVRHSGLQWQVRNARALMKGEVLEIGAIRNDLTDKREIVIAPMRGMEVPYLHRSRRVEQLSVQPYDAHKQELELSVAHVDADGGELEVICTASPKKVKGAAAWNFRDGRVIISLQEAGDVKLSF